MRRTAPRVSYVLPRPDLGGGNKVVIQHAQLLDRAGWAVTLLGDGPPPGWIALQVAWHDLTRGKPPIPRQDLVVATFWTTIAVAHDLGLGPVAHFCQGYEGDAAHLAEQRPAIVAAYREPLVTLAIAPHLQRRLAECFGRKSALVTPPLDPLFRPRARWRPRRRPWIAVPGIFEDSTKDVPTALGAINRLRDGGIPCRVLRVSLLPLSSAERSIVEPDRFLHAVPPGAVARALRDVDLLLLASRPWEGFGLPLLEAFASGVPAVASRVPSTGHYAAAAASLVEPGDAAGFAAAAAELLRDPAAWRRRRRAGLRVARRFEPRAVLPQLTGALEWAIAEAA